MAKDRSANHLYPGLGWRWQQFGDATMLVTDGNGCDVVLSTRHKGGGRAELTTCDQAGHMVPLKPDSSLGQLLAAIPDLIQIAREIEAADDRPRYLPALRAALQLAGVL